MVGGACVAAEPLAPLAIGEGLARLRLALALAAGGGRPAQPGTQSRGTAGGLAAPQPRRPEDPEGDAGDGEAGSSVELVNRAVAGDAEAFAALYDRYVDLVYRYIYYRAGGAALAEDLTSETFLRALRRISTFRWQGKDFGAWLVTIARNLVADHFKSGKYRLEVASADVTETAPEPLESGPEDQVLDAISNAQLVAAVKRLGAEQQECISLRFLQGLSLADTARIMGKNEGAIKALQYRAVRALARMLPAEGW